MHILRVIRIIKNIATYILNLALTATSLGYFWNAEYTPIEISPEDRQLMCSDANLFNLADCFENKTAKLYTLHGDYKLYFVYKIVNTTNHRYVLNEDYKICAAISYDTFSWFDLATNGKYAYRTISSIEYFVYLIFGIHIVIRSLARKGLPNLAETTCFAGFRAKFKRLFYKLLFLPGYILVDSIDYTTRCVIRANSRFVSISIYIVFSNFLILFVVFAALGKRCGCHRETNPFNFFFAVCAYATFIYLWLCIPIYILHFGGSWIAIFVGVNVTIDMVSDFVLDFFEPVEEAPVEPSNTEINNET